MVLWQTKNFYGHKASHRALNYMKKKSLIEQLHNNNLLPNYYQTLLFTFYTNRYSREKYSFAVTGSREAFDLSYWRKVNRDLQIGSSLACSHREGKAIGTVYYRIERPDCTIRGLFDSDWSVGFTYQRWVWQGEASFNLFIFADFVMPENTSLVGGFQRIHTFLPTTRFAKSPKSD